MASNSLSRHLNAPGRSVAGQTGCTERAGVCSMSPVSLHSRTHEGDAARRCVAAPFSLLNQHVLVFSHGCDVAQGNAEASCYGFVSLNHSSKLKLLFV